MPSNEYAPRGAALIFSAPSGCGKTTIINSLRQANPQLGFSISATSRAPRPGEQNGREYYFLTEQQFRERIARNDFLEWQEVYTGILYGTLRSEVQRLWCEGFTVLFDIDVKGALNVKRELGESALTVFIEPPSLPTLRARLEKRGTETPEAIARRLARAEEEMEYAPRFDARIINDTLPEAIREAQRTVENFLALRATR